MKTFDSDYTCGAHPKVLKALVATNDLQTPGYGSDKFTTEAIGIIRDLCKMPDAEVFLFVGGTQTNAIAIDGLISPYSGVIAADTSHIYVHEGGSVEACGHKIITLPSHEGKLYSHDVENYMKALKADDSHEHMVQPELVYLTFATELGTIYTLEELEDFRCVCDKYGLIMYLDGARLAYGLAAEANNVTIPDIARLCDAFYIGGTKTGLLFGEALVAKPGRLKHFFTRMKLGGAVLAKGRLLGVQFSTLLKDGLFFEIGEKAVRLALKLRRGFEAVGFKAVVDSPTNQQFFNLDNNLIHELKETISFEYFGPVGEQSSNVRFVTGWNTEEEDIDFLLAQLKIAMYA